MTVDFVLPLKLLWLLRSIYDSGFCVATETAVARSICLPVILEDELGYRRVQTARRSVCVGRERERGTRGGGGERLCHCDRS